MKKNIRILIIGYGSIAKKHHKVLKKLGCKNIKILSERNLNGQNFINEAQVSRLEPDYIIISSDTGSHIKHIRLIEKSVKNKIVLVEKPIFEKVYNLRSLKNKYLINYQLRLHPVIQEIRRVFRNKKILNLQVNCNSFLPDWRIREYTSTYSSKKKGGGVLLDLSHELDYILWIFKKINIHHVANKKLSDLNIKTDDHLSLAGTIPNNGNLNIGLSYFSKLHRRSIYIDTNTTSCYGDLIKNSISIRSARGKYFKVFKIDQLKLLADVHKKILKKNFKDICSFKEGIAVLNLIDKIKKFSK